MRDPATSTGIGWLMPVRYRDHCPYERVVAWLLFVVARALEALDKLRSGDAVGAERDALCDRFEQSGIADTLGETDPFAGLPCQRPIDFKHEAVVCQCVARGVAHIAWLRELLKHGPANRRDND